MLKEKTIKSRLRVRYYLTRLIILIFLVGCQTAINYPGERSLNNQTPMTETSSIRSLCPEIQKGVKFLRDRYNPQIYLLNESPNVAPNMYWLTNDNVLAAYTLEKIGSTESIELASSIQKGLDTYGYKRNGLIEVIWGEKIDFPPKIAQPEKIFIDELITIQHEAHTGSEFLDWQEYSDLSFMGALNDYNQGKTREAIKIFQNTLVQFDGIGFRDKAFNNHYETYKIALAIYTAHKIDFELNNKIDLINTLLSIQSDNGGFYTHYIDRTHPVGDTNTETTAFSLLALLESQCGED